MRFQSRNLVLPLLGALMIPAEYLTKVFLSHLHTDHWADLNALWAGGWTSGRPGPLEV